MSKHETPDDREPLLSWLNPGAPHEEAEAQIRRLTQRLVDYFRNRGVRDAEDLASQTWAIVIRKMQNAELSEGFASNEARNGYVFGVARNVLLEWLRRRPNRKEDELVAEVASPQRLPILEIVDRDCQEIIKRLFTEVLSRLRTPDREIFEVVVLAEEERTLRTKSAEMGVPYSALRQRVSRATIRFKELALKSNLLNDALSCLGWSPAVPR